MRDNSTADLFQNATLKDILENPAKFGAPTFDQFCKQYDQWKSHRNKLDSIDNGPKGLSSITKKVRYSIDGVPCDNLEQVEKRANDFGVTDMGELDMVPEVIPLGGGYCDILVKFKTRTGQLIHAPK